MIEDNTWQRLAVGQELRHETLRFSTLFNKNQAACYFVRPAKAVT